MAFEEAICRSRECLHALVELEGEGATSSALPGMVRM